MKLSFEFDWQDYTIETSDSDDGTMALLRVRSITDVEVNSGNRSMPIILKSCDNDWMITLLDNDGFEIVDGR